MTRNDQTRTDILRNTGIRLLAAVWTLAILVVFLPLAAVVWIMWYLIAIPGQILGNTWAFKNGPGMNFANNLFTWFTMNLRVALWGNSFPRPGVQWWPSTKYSDGRYDRHKQ